MKQKILIRQQLAWQCLVWATLLSPFASVTVNAHPSLMQHTHVYKRITGVEFRPPTPYQSRSTNRKTMTTRLPPASTLTRGSAELAVGVLVSMSNGSGELPDFYQVGTRSNEASFPAAAQGKVTCQGNGCRLNHLWAASLTNSVTIPLRVKQSKYTVAHNLTWVIEPPPPGTYVERLDVPTVRKGNLLNMTARLTSNAPTGGTRVFWKLIPSNCFSAAAGDVSYNTNPAVMNNFVIPAGNRFRRFSVRANSGCTSNSGNLKTWVENSQTDSAPYAKYRTFRIDNPPRNFQRSAPAPTTRSMPNQRTFRKPVVRAIPNAPASTKRVAPKSAGSDVRVTGANVRAMKVQRGRYAIVTLKGRNLKLLKVAHIERAGKRYPGLSAKVLPSRNITRIKITATRGSRIARNLKLYVSDGRRQYLVPLSVEVR